MGSRGNNGGGGVKDIPEASRKMVRSLKEIVGCPEAEIYAMLKECAMDPNEAVNRLLSQDPFHEVKSKREKKKEIKNTTESKSRGTNSHSGHGSRGGYNHYLGSSDTQFSSSDSRTAHGKSAYKKENGSNVYASHSFVSSGTTENNAYHRPPAYSEPVTAEKKAVNTDTADGSWSSSLPSSGLSQPSSNPLAWGVPGQVSMADIVKMGRPHGRGSGSVNQSQSNMSYHNEVPVTKMSANDEWPVVEPSTRISSVALPASGWHTDASHLSSNPIDQHPEPEQDEVPAVKHENVENVGANHDEYTSVPSERIHDNNTEGASYFNGDIHENGESHQPHSGAVEYREEDIGVSGSSMASNLQQLNIVDDREAQSEDDAAVIIPNHLLVQTEECLHLSFGSFGSLAAGPSSSVTFSSRPTHSNKEVAHADEDAPSVGQLDSRNSDYYVEEPPRMASDGNLVHRLSGSGARAYDSSSVSQLEVLNRENQEVPHENRYVFPSTNYSFENTTQLKASFPSSQTSAQMQTFPNQAYANNLQSSIIPTSAQSTRESDYTSSPFVTGQSMPSKYGNSVSSVSSSTIPIPEVLQAAGLTLNSQNTLGNNIATGPALPQLLMDQYSQMAQLTNMMGYQFMPQNYYMPGAYHQSLGGMLPQYKNNVSVSNLPHSAAVASGYGGNFGSSNNLPGNFPSAPGATAVGYEELLSAQYKDMNHLLSLQQAQNDNQPMWVQGHGSRTMSGVPTNMYYNYPSQQQQQQPPAGFRQNQQQVSQNYGSFGNLNSNFYDSQSAILLDHQQPQLSPRDQHLWKNSY